MFEIKGSKVREIGEDELKEIDLDKITMTIRQSLIGTKNAGFEIITQGEKAVIGVREKDGMHVAWDYSIRDGEPGYCWGRYGSKEYAQECFGLKEAGKYSGE